MKIKKGSDCRYLDVDLSEKTWSVYTPPMEDIAKFMGGKGLGIKIYFDRLKDRLSETDPLGEDNILIYSMGPLLATGAPCSARFEVVTKSPLTGLMVGSSCGGPFGEMCKTAGWDGVIISGCAESPVVLRITPDGAEFEPAGELWGMKTEECREKLAMTKQEAAAVIGPAGENLVSFANIRSGHRFAGRGGVGAVMGSKKLKAVVARGKEYKCVPVLEEKFRKTTARERKYISRNKMTKKFTDFGTNANNRPGIKSGFSAVRNFRDRYHPDLDNLSGETMAAKYSTSFSTCRYCNILCGHKGTYPDGEVRQIPEYETTGMFGANIENFNTDLIGEWNDLMNDLGMDTISAGGTIAWAMEAGEKGIRQTELVFGKTDNIGRIITDTAYRTGEGAELADGTRALAQKYGGEDFAINVKGLECAAYDPRAAWGQGLSYAVYNKGGCHLGSYVIGLEVLLGYIPPHITMGKASWTVFMEDFYAAINSLQTCLFTAFGVMTEPAIPKFLPVPILKVATSLMPRVAQALMDWSILSDLFWSVTGIRMNKFDFLKAGRRTTKLERWMNGKMGCRAEDDTLPGRFTKEKETAYPGRNTVVPIEKMIKQYYRIRRYDKEGLPSTVDLEKLGVAV